MRPARAGQASAPRFAASAASAARSAALATLAAKRGVVFASTHPDGMARVSPAPDPSSLARPMTRFAYFFFFNDTATTEIYTLPYTTLFRSQEITPARPALAVGEIDAEHLAPTLAKC